MVLNSLNSTGSSPNKCLTFRCLALGISHITGGGAMTSTLLLELYNAYFHCMLFNDCENQLNHMNVSGVCDVSFNCAVKLDHT